MDGFWIDRERLPQSLQKAIEESRVPKGGDG
jgi:hypothetical protein